MAIRLETTVSGGLQVATLMIDNPPVNVLDLDHCKAMAESLRQLRQQDTARVVVLRGAGRAFSTGVDIQQHTPEMAPKLLPAFHAIFPALLDLRAVSVAAVHGFCLGGALELALGCDRVVAEEGAKLGFPEIRVGCYPPVAIPLVSQRAGPGRATEMIFGGGEVPVATLQTWGLVDRAVPKGELNEGLSQELKLYGDKSPAVLAMAADLMHDESRRSWGARIAQMEKQYLEELLPHPDASEGIKAFAEKRKPAWRDAAV